MYIVATANGAKSFCPTLAEATEKYYELLNWCEFVKIFKTNASGAVEEIRSSF